MQSFDRPALYTTSKSCLSQASDYLKQEVTVYLYLKSIFELGIPIFTKILAMGISVDSSCLARINKVGK